MDIPYPYSPETSPQRSPLEHRLVWSFPFLWSKEKKVTSYKSWSHRACMTLYCIEDGLQKRAPNHCISVDYFIHKTVPMQKMSLPSHVQLTYVFHPVHHLKLQTLMTWHSGLLLTSEWKKVDILKHKVRLLRLTKDSPKYLHSNVLHLPFWLLYYWEELHQELFN